MAHFRVSRKAHADIRDIGRYTQQQWGREQRRRYLAGLDATFGHLANNPLLASERPEFDPPVRIYRYEKHLIVYLAESDGVFIVRVLHERMEFSARLSSV